MSEYGSSSFNSDSRSHTPSPVQSPSKQQQLQGSVNQGASGVQQNNPSMNSSSVHYGTGAKPASIHKLSASQNGSLTGGSPHHHHHRQYSSSSDNDDPQFDNYQGTTTYQTTTDTVPGAPGYTTRMLTPDEFKMLFKESIAKAHHIERPMPMPPQLGGHHPPGRPTSSGTSRPTSTYAKVRGPQQHIVGSGSQFIDPYNRTRFKNKITAPDMAHRSPQRGGNSPGRKPLNLPPSRSGSTQQTSGAARKLHSHVKQASSNNPQHSFSAADDDMLMRLQQELNEIKFTLRKRDNEVNHYRNEFRKAEEKLSKAEHHLLSNRPQKEAQTVEGLVHGLKAKISNLEQSLVKNEEDTERLRKNAKASRVAELQSQCNVYMAEVRRLQQNVALMKNASASGNEGAALQEAHLTLKNKDMQIASLQEKIQTIKDDVRAAQLETLSWKRHHDEGKKSVEDANTKLDELRQAPVEIARLRSELEASQRNEEEALRECQRIQDVHNKKLEMALQSAQSEGKNTVETVTKEREALKNQVHVLQKEIDEIRAQKHQKNVLDDQAVERKINEKVTEANLLAQDRDFAQRKEMQELRERCNSLEKQVKDSEEMHKDELEQQKLKDQQRQQNLLITIGQYEGQRQAQELKIRQEVEEKMSHEREAIDMERKTWDTEMRRRKEELANVESTLERKRREEADPTPVKKSSTTPSSLDHGHGYPAPGSGLAGSSSSSDMVIKKQSYKSQSQSGLQQQHHGSGSGVSPNKRTQSQTGHNVQNPQQSVQRSPDQFPLKQAQSQPTRYGQQAQVDDTYSEITTRKQDDTDARSSTHSLMMEQDGLNQSNEITGATVNSSPPQNSNFPQEQMVTNGGSMKDSEAVLQQNTSKSASQLQISTSPVKGKSTQQQEAAEPKSPDSPPMVSYETAKGPSDVFPNGDNEIRAQEPPSVTRRGSSPLSVQSGEGQRKNKTSQRDVVPEDEDSDSEEFLVVEEPKKSASSGARNSRPAPLSKPQLSSDESTSSIEEEVEETSPNKNRKSQKGEPSPKKNEQQHGTTAQMLMKSEQDDFEDDSEDFAVADD